MHEKERRRNKNRNLTKKRLSVSFFVLQAGQAVPTEVRDRVRSEVRAQWKRNVRVRIWKRGLFFGLATAAMILLLYSGALLMIARDIPHQNSGQGFVENQAGSVFSLPVERDNQRIQSLVRGEFVLTGSWLESATNGRVLLHLLNGATVRMDTNTRFCLISESSFILEQARFTLTRKAPARS